VELERGMTNVPYAKIAGRQGRNSEWLTEDWMLEETRVDRPGGSHTHTKLSKIKMGKFERDIADANWT